MTDEQFDALIKALFDIKAEIRDLRNDVRNVSSKAPEVEVGRRLFERRGGRL